VCPQHVPAPSSAEQLSAAMLDANIARRGQAQGGPSLVDPTRARALKDEALRTRFGLRRCRAVMCVQSRSAVTCACAVPITW
jgi:hypothetical protein